MLRIQGSREEGLGIKKIPGARIREGARAIVVSTLKGYLKL